MNSNKPYLLRALHEWICDNDCTPYLYVNTDAAGLQLPTHLLDENPLVLNTSLNACKDLQLDNEAVSFQARFSGQVYDVYLPMAAIMAIVARENGQGMSFEWASSETDDGDDSAKPQDREKTDKNTKTPRKNTLKVIR